MCNLHTILLSWTLSCKGFWINNSTLLYQWWNCTAGIQLKYNQTCLICYCLEKSNTFNYCKIPKISHGVYIFQRPCLKGLFLEGLVFRGAYARRKMCVSKSIGLAYSWKEVYHFCFGLFVFEGNFQAQAPRGAYTQRGVFVEGFSVTSLGALIWRGLFWEFYGIIIIPTQYIP